MKTKLWFITSIVLSLNLLGCSDPKVANDKNIHAALSNYFSDAGGAICLNLQQWPVDLAPDDLQMITRFPQGPAAVMNALQQMGVVQSQEIKLDGVDFFGRPNIGKRYTLTESGKTYYRETSTDQFGQSHPNDLCFAHKKLESVLSWKPNSEGNNHPQEINVTYRYTMTDIAPWIHSVEFKTAFPDVNIDAKPKSEQIALSLMDKGWWVNNLTK